MSANPYEVLRLSPTASEREIMMRVRRPFAGADISQLQQAMQEVRFSAEKRVFYELTTFHDPNYDFERAEIEVIVDLEQFKGLERFCTVEFAATLSRGMMQYLLEHSSAILSKTPSYELGADEAFALAAELAETDIWLLHDLTLLTQRYLRYDWHREIGEEGTLADALCVYFACLMRQVGEAKITSELHSAHEAGGTAAAEAGMRLFLDDQLERISELLTTAISAGNAENLFALAAAWFEQRERWNLEQQTSVHERWFERVDAVVAAELNRQREKVLASGVEREGVSGMHGASLELIDRLLLERKVRHERLIEILLDGYTTWLNEYINAALTRHAVEAVRRLGDVCKRLLADRISAKLRNDVRAAMGRAMYVTYDHYNQAMEAFGARDPQEAVRLMEICRDLATSLPDEASITVNNIKDKSKTETTAKSMHERVVEELKVMELVAGAATAKPLPSSGGAKSGQTRYGTTKVSDTGSASRGAVPPSPASGQSSITRPGTSTRSTATPSPVRSGGGSRSSTSSGEVSQEITRGFAVGISHTLGVIGLVGAFNWFKDYIGALEGFANASDITRFCYEGVFYLVYAIFSMTFCRNAWVCLKRDYAPLKSVQLASALFWMQGFQELVMLGIGFAATWIAGRFVEGGTALPFLLFFGLSQLVYAIQTHNMLRQIE